MINHDLGTYHFRVVFDNNDGFIQEVHTGSRYTYGRNNTHPLTAERIGPTWNSESEMFQTMLFSFQEGNYSCDCNRKSFLDDAHQREDQNYDCGDTLVIKEITAIRPDGSLCALYKKEDAPPST
jgi:hypothetical protein